MMLTTLILAGALSTAPLEEVQIEAEVPSVFVPGRPFQVRVRYAVGAAGGQIAFWQMGPSLFEIGDVPLAERVDGAPPLILPPRGEMSWSADISSFLSAHGVDGDFELKMGDASFSVTTYVGVPEGVDFMTLSAEELRSYHVLLSTNQGDMIVEFFPDSAPGHVRNFLDLSYTGFYEGTLFHRVSPTFMIQGGCPNTKTDNKQAWGTGNGPRTLDAEFSKRKHVRGILSMARGQSSDSASSQFFVMTADSPFLNNQYSIFGRLLSGDATLDRIANAQGRANRDGTTRPSKPQRIERVLVLTTTGQDT